MPVLNFERPARVPRRIAYIVHPNPVIADDLREILASLGFSDVQYALSLLGVPVDGVDAVIVQGDMATLSRSSHFVRWALTNVRVLVVDSDSVPPTDMPNVGRLRQPFRSEDVRDALKSIGLT